MIGGIDALAGGNGNDGFFFGADGNLTAADRIDGGAGIDTIALRGDHSGANAIAFDAASFTGIEILTFLSSHSNEYGGQILPDGFDYHVTLADANLAPGASLDVIAGNLRADETFRFDARAETDGNLRVISGAGDDTLFGGSGGGHRRRAADGAGLRPVAPLSAADCRARRGAATAPDRRASRTARRTTPSPPR